MEQKKFKRGMVAFLAVGLIGTTFVGYKANELKEAEQAKQEKIDQDFFEFQAKIDKQIIIKKQEEKEAAEKKADQEKLDRLNKIAEEKKKKAEEEQAKYEAILAEQEAKKVADQKAYEEWQAQLQAEAEAQAVAAQQPVEPVQTEAVQTSPEVVEPVQEAPQVVAQTSSAKSEIAFRESTNNYNATNGKYIGMYQLDAAYLNGDHSPANQEATAERYVAERYGSWEAALAFHNSNGWY